MSQGKSPKVLGYKEFFQDSCLMDFKGNSSQKSVFIKKDSNKIIVQPKSFFNSNRMGKNAITKKPLKKMDDFLQINAPVNQNRTNLNNDMEEKKETPRFIDTNNLKLNVTGMDLLRTKLIDEKLEKENVK